MGINSSKKEILQILENSATIFYDKYYKIEYKFSFKVDVEGNLIKEKEEEENTDEFFEDQLEGTQDLNDIKLNIENIKMFPYNPIGTISVKFPLNEEIFVYTCFLIDTNVVVTLASNLENKNKGGKAKSIVTSFSEENVKWENIIIQGEEKSKLKFIEDKKQNDFKNNLSSKLAVILYKNELSNEWLGVEGKKN